MFVCSEMIQFLPCNNLVVTQQGRIPSGHCSLKRLFNGLPPLLWDICIILIYYFKIFLCIVRLQGAWYLDSALEMKNLL